MRASFGVTSLFWMISRGGVSRSPYLPPPKPQAPTSSERSAFCSDSLNVRPMAIASPTLFICVVSVASVCGNFSKVNRGTLVTT